mgnify:CR=1 FL=1
MADFPKGFSLPRGFMIFAHNNPSIDYGTLALCNALLIKKHLGNNKVALISDPGTVGHLEGQYSDRVMRKAFDRIVIDEVDQDGIGNRRFHDTRYTAFTDAYRNTNRPNAYDLSPFEETVMIDADYLMLDPSMDLVWDHADDFLCNRKTVDLDHKANDFGFDNRFNEMSIPLYWATAVYFRKTERSRLIFELMAFVKENYSYYQYLYRFGQSGYFRNDYALSIAVHMANNLMEYGSINNLPVDRIQFSMEHDELHAFRQGKCFITSEPRQGDFNLHAIDTNVHMMNKRAVLRHKDEIIDYALS